VLWGDGERILSRLEKRFIQLLKKHGLPLPTARPAAASSTVVGRTTS
jgi:hypothetical protein